MRPSYSPRRITIDGQTGKRLYDNLEHHEKQDHSTSIAGRQIQAVIYGVVISIVICPCMIGYSAIIFSDPIFKDYLPILFKLTLISCVVHQLTCSIFSPLKFAIGQVQDAGLIFLSSMATSIVQHLQDVPENQIIATVLVHLSLSAIAVGITLLLIGHFQMASVVQFLPMPVVGGYLAFIGLFTIRAGLSLMCGIHLNSITSLITFFSWKPLLLALPGFFFGVGLVWITDKLKHFAVLPTCLVMIPLIFYSMLYFLGISYQDAQTMGWITPSSQEFDFWKVWSLFSFQNLYWSAMIQELPTTVVMALMISFSSSLDIAAINMGTGATMDYNAQLKVVGLSNLMSGLTGGYTGSYIFSQTLLAYRSHTNTRVIGLTVAIVEITIVMIPVSIISFFPNFFFGAVMIFIGFDLVRAWLYNSLYKLLLREYCLLLFSFLCICTLGPLQGMAFGVAAAAFNFIFEYSRVNVSRQVYKRSNVIRNKEQRDLLERGQNRIIIIELHGHIFFGSSIQMLNFVKKKISLQSESSTGTEKSCDDTLPLLQLNALAGINKKKDFMYCDSTAVTKFLVLDFTAITGMDVTAARSCFLNLKQILSKSNCYIIYTGMGMEVEYLLKANDVISTQDKLCKVFLNLDGGLEWCEKEIINIIMKEQNLQRGSSFFEAECLPLQDILLGYLRSSCTSAEINDISVLFETKNFSKAQKLYHPGDVSNSWFILGEGEIQLNTISKETGFSGLESDLLRRVGPGCIFGDLDYFLERPRTMDAVVLTKDATVYQMSQKTLECLRQTNLNLYVVIQKMVLRASYFTTSDTLNSIVI